MKAEGFVASVMGGNHNSRETMIDARQMRLQTVQRLPAGRAKSSSPIWITRMLEALHGHAAIRIIQHQTRKNLAVDSATEHDLHQPAKSRDSITAKKKEHLLPLWNLPPQKPHGHPPLLSWLPLPL